EGGGRGVAREGGVEKSLRREWNNRTEGVIPVPQAFVSPLHVSCVSVRKLPPGQQSDLPPHPPPAPTHS
uniref:Uncharacterized protein n=1 Tax=Nothobranchius furzeri TaxID=105023 RepID=A0A8C6KS08_NOTFU